MKEPANYEKAAIPLHIAERACEIIDDAFDLFKDRLKKMSEAEKAFGPKKEEVEKRIKRGARRTNSEIV